MTALQPFQALMVQFGDAGKRANVLSIDLQRLFELADVGCEQLCGLSDGLMAFGEAFESFVDIHATFSRRRETARKTRIAVCTNGLKQAWAGVEFETRLRAQLLTGEPFVRRDGTQTHFGREVHDILGAKRVQVIGYTESGDEANFAGEHTVHSGGWRPTGFDF